jgi:hypothetical protein
MNFRTAIALSAIVASTALPFTASAQFRGDRDRDSSDGRYDRRDNDRRRDGRWDNRRDHDRRDRDRRWDNRRDHDGRRDDRWDNRRDRDRRDNDRRWDDRRYDDRWDNRRDDNRRWDDNRRYDDRQDSKNEWRNIAIGAGALGILGLLSKDNTLTFGGALGALYSLNRYEQDRRSQNSYDRARARYFDHEYFYRDGVRYDRRTVNRNGQRYYQFERSR